MREELPPVDDTPKPAHGVAKGSYTERLRALRAGQVPVAISRPPLFKRGKKAPKAVAEEVAPAESAAQPKPKRVPSDHPRPHKGVGRCPPCTCGCAMMKHASPWIVAELRAGGCKTHPACSAYAPTKAALDQAMMAKVAKERSPPKPVADPVAKTVDELQVRVASGAKVTARDAAKAFRAADRPAVVPVAVSPPDALGDYDLGLTSKPVPAGRKIRVVAMDHMAPERMKTILTEVTAFADELKKSGSSHLAGIASDLQNSAHRLRDLLADLLISRLAKA